MTYIHTNGDFKEGPLSFSSICSTDGTCVFLITILKTKVMKRESLALIHRALHAKPLPEKVVVEGGEELKVNAHGAGMPYINYEGFKFMAQNKAKRSAYALRALKGEKITWGVRSGKWLYIEGEEGKEASNYDEIFRT